jgi:hypothetical protein
MPQRMTSQQFRRFEAPVRATWISGTAYQLLYTYQTYFRAFGVDAQDIAQVCQSVVRWAEERGINGERDVAQLCCVAVTLGHEFWLDPRFDAYLAASVGNAELMPAQATQRLIGFTGDWLSALWNNDTLAGFVERLCHYVRQDTEPDSATLRIILPGHWIQFDEDYHDRLTGWFLAGLPPLQMPAQRLACLSCALVHGTGWMRDPQYGLLLRIVMTAPNTAEMAHALSELYGQIA